MVNPAKRLGFLVCLSFVFCPCLVLGQDKGDAGEKEAPSKKIAEQHPVGYFLGYAKGQEMYIQGLKPEDFNIDAFAAGVFDALSKRNPALTSEQLEATQKKFVGMMRERQKELDAIRKKAGEERKKMAVLNAEKSKLWMAKNGKQKDVKELEKGIQYKVVKKGSGGSPTVSDIIKIHYKGSLTNGKVFDSTKKDKPLEMELGQLIPGWKAALPKMKVGSKWILYIPPEMGYGERGAGDLIGPNEVLIFEIELLDII